MGKSAPLSINSLEKNILNTESTKDAKNFRFSCEFSKGKRIYMIYLKFIFHFPFYSLSGPFQVRCKSVVGPFLRREPEWEVNGSCKGFATVLLLLIRLMRD